MSDPWWQAVRMQSDDATQPLGVQELRELLEEWAGISSQMIDLLHATVGGEPVRNWQPHFGQIVKAVSVFGDRCRNESADFGNWQADGAEPEDIFEAVRSEGQRLVNWLHRIMAE
jgi:hypothetical protein